MSDPVAASAAGASAASTVPDDLLDDTGASALTQKEFEERQRQLKLQEFQMQHKEKELQLRLQIQDAEAKGRDTELQLRLQLREMALKQREMELQLKEKEFQLKIAQQNQNPVPNVPQLPTVPTAPPRNYPTFQEGDDFEGFIITFQRVCVDYGVRKEHYMRELRPLLPQILRSVEAGLSPEEMHNFDLFLDLARSHLGLTAEAVRQQLRATRWTPTDNCRELGHRITRKCELWAKAAKVDTFEGLLSLMAMEQFLWHTPPAMRNYILDKDPKTMLDVTTLAQRFMETRGSQISQVQLSGPRKQKPGNQFAYKSGNQFPNKDRQNTQFQKTGLQEMGRKRKAPEAQNEEPSASGSKLELRWEWETSGNRWQPFLPEESQALSQAARAGKLSANIGESHVDLRRMVRRNKQTGEETPVAAAVCDQDSYFVWQWQGDQEGIWFAYAADTCLALEAARNGHREPIVEVTVGRTHYKLDTTRMVQTNTQTAFERQMERRESDAAEVEDEGSQQNNSALNAARPIPAKKDQNRGDAPASQGEGDSTESVKTLIVKGKVPVDPGCTAKLGKAHVYCEEDDVYDVMLNQTNVQFNNNKYYLIQLLEDDGARNYSVWMRWGRVGKPGQHSLVSCAGDLAKAKDIFTKKFLDKTKNEWAKRCNFQKVPGKYDLLHLDYEANDPAEEEAVPQETSSCPKPVSRLEPRVQALVQLICNIRVMEEMVMEMKYDTKKAPLGKLTAEQIRAGYQSLQKVEACLKGKQTGRTLLEACNEFYTRIPHDFGLKTPPLIHTEKELKEKMQLLEALSEIRIGIKAVRSEQLDQEHPLDRSYRGLNCDLQPLERDSPDFQVLERYLSSTHAPTHKDYTMTLLEIFVLKKESAGSDSVFRSDLPNRMLLWHGSRLGNWAGILSQGLRVAPPEAPVTGYMFGKGIYFADMSSKSANYCFATREKHIGLLLLSEVALGECNELLEANPEAEKLLAGKHSTKGLGKLAPSPANSVTLHGAMVPLGPAVETGVLNPHGYTLNYNEFIVYDPQQVRMKYLLKVHFNFTQLW